MSSEDNHRIIPAVQEQQVYASNLNLSSGYHVVLQDNRLENERLWLKKYLQNDFQLIENSQGKTIRLILQSSSEQKEDEYQKDIEDEVKIISAYTRGIFYGIQTLRQLMITTAGQCDFASTRDQRPSLLPLESLYVGRISSIPRKGGCKKYFG